MIERLCCLIFLSINFFVFIFILLPKSVTKVQSHGASAPTSSVAQLASAFDCYPSMAIERLEVRAFPGEFFFLPCVVF